MVRRSYTQRQKMHAAVAANLKDPENNSTGGVTFMGRNKPAGQNKRGARALFLPR